MELRVPTEAERAGIPALLEQSGLPVADLGTSDVHFIVAADREAVLGTIGVERHDDVGLLRSLSVVPTARGSGLGARLVEALEAHAARAGLRALVLLTTTAREFFAKRGYVVIAREDAPAAAQRSAEFRSLCPASSTCMLKNVEAA